jgi:ABC-type dipeptide/oligopeptide/nickel transport system permease subunit
MGRRIKSFWIDFSHNKIGLFGVALLSVYLASAVLVPIISLGIDPDEDGLADDHVPPEWMTILNPSMRNLPRTSEYEANWTTADFDLVPEYIRTHPNFTWALDGGSFVLNISGIMVNETEPFCIVLESSSFSYTYDPPRGLGFKIAFDVAVDPKRYSIAYNQKNESYVASSVTSKSNVEINLTTPSTTLSIWDAEWNVYQVSYLTNNFIRGLQPLNLSSADQRLITNKQTYMTILSSDFYWGYRMNYVNSGGGLDAGGLSRALFGTQGDRTFRAYIFAAPYSTGAAKPMYFYARVTPVKTSVKGMIWGFMGTDYQGHDVWSRVVHGVKISLAIGMISAVVSLSLGVLVGVASGYLGGTADELMMRFVDLLMALPVLPLLMVLTSKFGRNIWYIVLFVAFFGWQGLSRVIRSKVLSLREAPFVESAMASGASRTHIMLRHVIPNVLPVILSDFVLSVPGAIVAEASLSFLGFGDPATFTWGREFNIMWIQGGAFIVLAWWWIIPPTVAITLLCLAFVFLGHALDEIVNPKLRRRR